MLPRREVLAALLIGSLVWAGGMTLAFGVVWTSTETIAGSGNGIFVEGLDVWGVFWVNSTDLEFSFQGQNGETYGFQVTHDGAAWLTTDILADGTNQTVTVTGLTFGTEYWWKVVV